MNILRVTGKFLDQPILINKLQKTVPAILIGAGSGYSIKETVKSHPDKRKKTAIKTGLTMGFTITSAIFAPKITNKIFKKSENLPKPLNLLIKHNTDAIEHFLKNNTVNSKTQELLNKAKSKVLKYKEVKQLYTAFDKNQQGQRLLNSLIPDPENIDSKEIFSEIGRLSVFGLIPVLGGITGGIIGDRLTDKHWKSKIPDKIKEGSYQYLANIFLCNIGAGGALAVLEKLNVKSKSARAIGMIGGIIATGILGGSTLANLIGTKVINPLLHCKNSSNNIFSERKPELLDISLHADDIATVAVMSGLKWIEPALPFMYTISGYRAGIGYRNGKHS